MTSLQQTEIPAEEGTPVEGEAAADTLFTFVGLFLVALLIWLTIRGKIREWFMK